MNLNLTLKPEIITRPTTHFLHVRKVGFFAEVAMPTWYAMFPLSIKEFLGASNVPKGMEYTKINSGK